MRKPASIFIFLLVQAISPWICFGQGQDGPTVTSRFETYEGKHLVEKVFVHTDRSFYLSGETVWFKLYVFDGLTSQLMNLSKVAYVDVIDDQHQSVLETMVKLENGTGNGTLSIPMSQTSGHFILRAYTRWMQNDDEAFFFRKTITIINPLISLSTPPRDSAAIDLQFFPEGGDLVAGLQSVVAFRAVNQNGKGIDFTGVIMDSHDNPVGNFSPVRMGMGKFNLTPSAGTSYHALVMAGKHTYRVPLPHVQPHGLVMQLTEAGDNIHVTVAGDAAYQESVTLFVHTGSKAVYEATRYITGGQAVFVLQKKQLGEGVSHLTVFDASRQPRCERLYFKRPQGDLSIRITGNHQYTQRSPVELDLVTRSKESLAEAAQMSVSVYRVDSLQKAEAIDLPSYLWLFSDLHGVVESPGYYLHRAGDEALDLLMLTHGWRRFKWEHVLDGKDGRGMLAPEYRYPLIHVRLADQSGNPVVNTPVYLTAVGKYFQLQRAVSDSLGSLYYEVPDFYGSCQVVLRADAPNDSLLKYTIQLPYASAASEKSPMPVSVSTDFKDEILNRSIWMQATNAYWEDKLNQVRMPVVDSTLFYGRPDETYLLDNYTRFPVMEEVLREYVPGIYVRRLKGHFVLHTLDINHKEIFDAPLILLDGVPVFDPDRIMAFDPLKIRRLDVKETESYDGEISAPGVISFFTYHGDLADFKLGKGDLTADYPGLELERQFYSPRYSTDPDSHEPDFRTTLFWNPNVASGVNGETKVSFFTGDIPGDYAVVVQGVGDQGDVGTALEMIHVSGQDQP